MSYEEDYRTPYRAKCACGNGFLRLYKVHLSNDWGQEREHETPAELVCDCCKEKYHYESNQRTWLSSAKRNRHSLNRSLSLNRKYVYTEQEEFIRKYDKQIIEDMLADMTAPKHRFIKDLRNESAHRICGAMGTDIHKRRSLAPMISYICKRYWIIMKI